MLKFANRLRHSRVPMSQPPYSMVGGGGIYVSKEAALKIAAFNRGVVYLSTQVAKLPILISNKKLVHVEDKLHYLLNVAPNSEMNAFVFWASLITNALKEGNGYAEIERNIIGAPIALHIIDNCHICPDRDPETKKLIYRVQTEKGERSIDPMNILHIPNLHMINGIGQSIVMWAQTSLGIAMGADEMASSIFANGGFPSGVLSTKGKLSKEAAERIGKSWQDTYGRKGTGKGKVAVLEEGTIYQAIEVNPQLLQFLESRQFEVIQIARFLGVPPHKLYDQSKATYDNVEQANIEVLTDTLDTWVVNIESEIDVKLLNGQYAGRKSNHDFFPLLRGDMKTRSDFYKSMFSIAALNADEIRERENLTPYEGGDKYYIQANNYKPVDRMDEIIDAEIKSKEPVPPAPAPDDEEDDKENSLVQALINKLDV